MRSLLLPSVLLALLPVARADEGMWLFTKPPVRQVKEKYGFEITPAWLEHLQKSSVRFGNGGSGSFVSVSRVIAQASQAGGLVERAQAVRRGPVK